MNKEIQNIIIVLPILLVAYFLLIFIQIGWDELFVIEKPFKVIWNVISISDLISWIPIIITYSIVGYLIFSLIHSNYKKTWLLLVGIIIAFINLYFSSAYFTEHATTIDYFWYYIRFVIPIFSLFLGFIVGSYFQKTAGKAPQPNARKRASGFGH